MGKKHTVNLLDVKSSLFQSLDHLYKVLQNKHILIDPLMMFDDLVENGNVALLIHYWRRLLTYVESNGLEEEFLDV